MRSKLDSGIGMCYDKKEFPTAKFWV